MSGPGTGWDPALAARQLRCERCGAVFGCRNTGEGDPVHCWCAGEAFQLPVPLPSAVGPYSECLCPTCLRVVAAELRA